MAEILLDTKFWNKVYKLLKPETAIAVKKNKGNTKGKLIPSDHSLKLNVTTNNKTGFMLKCMTENVEGRYSAKSKLLVAKQRASKEGLSGSKIIEIEKAIVEVAVTQSLLPESALYNGQPVIEARKQAEKSTTGFGFVYFIRNDEIYKIGITENLLRRMKELNPDEILNSVRCSNYQEIEKTMHTHFKKTRIPQTEYFRLNAVQVEEAHALMTEMARY